MPNAMSEVSECCGDEEVMAEGNKGGGIRSCDEGDDEFKRRNSEFDSTVGLNEGEEEKLPVVGGRYSKEYNCRGSSFEAVFQKKRSEDDGNFAKLGPDTKDTELRLGLPEVKDDVLGKDCVRIPDPVFFDGILQGGRIVQNPSRKELDALCLMDSKARGYSIQGQECAFKEEFKLKPMFREFSTLDPRINLRFSTFPSGVKRIFSETLESGPGGASGEPKQPATSSQKLNLPPPLPVSYFNFPSSGEPKQLVVSGPNLNLPPPLPASLFNFSSSGELKPSVSSSPKLYLPPEAWRMKLEQNKTVYGQFSGQMGSNEVKSNEAALPIKPPCADQKVNPGESQPSQKHSATSSEQRAASAVGWPPVRRSFRKNIDSQPKPPPPAQPAEPPAPPAPVPAPVEKKPATMFVKVNWEGFPFGRKIDLKTHDSYDKLYLALDDMLTNFPNSSSSSNPPFLLRRGDNVLVYEDDEGDRMLVGDVPWRMFVTAVKRLRVMRSSEVRVLANKEFSVKSNAGTS